MGDDLAALVVPSKKRKRQGRPRIGKSVGPGGETHVHANPEIDKQELASALMAAVATATLDGKHKATSLGELYKKLYNRPNMALSTAKNVGCRELHRLRQSGDMDRALERIGISIDIIAEKLHEHLEAWMLGTIRSGKDTMTIPVPNYKAQGAALQMLIDVMGLNKPRITEHHSGPLAHLSDEEMEKLVLEMDGRGEADARYGQSKVIQDQSEGGTPSVGAGEATGGEPAEMDSAS